MGVSSTHAAADQWASEAAVAVVRGRGCGVSLIA
jgi:hypothetical protein